MRHYLILVRDKTATAFELAGDLVAAGHHVSVCLVEFGNRPLSGNEPALNNLSEKGAVLYYFPGGNKKDNPASSLKGLLIRPLHELGRLAAECDTMMVL
ncbi:MAG: hypothetical protein M1269_06350 [Chloroflexi bacterium]|nr:hypothetical protein [Chloroflexota bacterium]